MTRIAIRPFAHADLPELHRMVCALAAHHGDTADVTPDELLHNVTGATPWATLLIADAGGPVGYAALSRRIHLQWGRRGMELTNLWIDPVWRGGGAGRMLIDAARREARALGCAYITVGTTEANIAAQKTYLRAGFEPQEARGRRFCCAL
ncbi:GNAT family N-acetyltransferase [Roseisalinus antarcticus]|uniref:Mycothiol acetyltransferase n=1 Tax=Roseisalinus antarcticus TaxID=254357 RepID=A0A1Y5SVX7_9RHOB|nr:GNAT family N-acetyltransferase [Roseisalinus antarcticus]SLN49683.1 Mycothiol acetyltransferase [Roseisalinus antarcticus]